MNSVKLLLPNRKDPKGVTVQPRMFGKYEDLFETIIQNCSKRTTNGYCLSIDPKMPTIILNGIKNTKNDKEQRLILDIGRNYRQQESILESSSLRCSFHQSSLSYQSSWI